MSRSPLPWEHYTIQQGDLLTHLWKEQWQLPTATLYRLIEDADQGQRLNRLRPGQHLEWRADSDGRLLALRLWESDAEGYQWDLDGDAIHGHVQDKERASHRVRYVESSAPAAGECMLCVGSLADLEGDLHFYGPINDPRPLPMQLPIPLST